MASAGFRHTVLLRSGGSAVAVGDNGNGQCNIPPLDEGMAYTHISAGNRHTVLLRSDGSAVAIGDNLDGQCDIPPLDEGLAYAQVSAGGLHTVLLRSDGSAVAIGDNSDGLCDIPPLDEGMTYTQISGGYEHTVLLRSDGSAIAIGFNCYGQCDIPPLDEGIAYNQVSAGHHHTVLLRSNGSAVAIGDHFFGQCYIPPLNEGMAYTQISAGLYHTVLLRSDGCAVAVGDGQCNIPPLDGNDVHPDFCGWEPYSASPVWWQCGCLRREWTWAIQHSDAAGNLLHRHYQLWQRLGFTSRICAEGWCGHPDMLHFGWGRTLPFDRTGGRFGLGDAQKDCPWSERKPPKSPARFARGAVVGQSLPRKSRCFGCWGGSK